LLSPWFLSSAPPRVQRQCVAQGNLKMKNCRSLPGMTGLVQFNLTVSFGIV
jgi:hypothetical protein